MTLSKFPDPLSSFKIGHDVLKPNRTRSKYLFRCFCTTAALLLIPLLLTGQDRRQAPAWDPVGPERETETENDTIPPLDRQVEPDTQYIMYFYFDQPFQRHDLLDDPYRDRDLHFDPARSGGWEQATTGHLGGPTRPMILEPDREIGFRTGIDDYRFYWNQIEDQRYYHQYRPYSNLMYAQGPIQDQNTTRAMFSTGFDDGVNVSIDYRRINHEGNYNRQRNFQTYISASLSNSSEDGKWHNFATFLSNAVLSWENGGITTDTLFREEFFEDDRTLIPVFSENAESRQQHRAVYFSNYRLIRDAEIFGLRLPLYANHYMSFGNRFFRYTDSSPDPEYYGQFFQVPGGFRRFMEVGTIEQRIGVAIGDIFNFERERVSNYLTVNLRWARHNVRFDPESFRTSEWFLSANAGLSPGDLFFIEASGELGVIGDAAGDAKLNARAGLEGTELSFFGKLDYLRRGPSLIETRFPSPEGYVYNNNLPAFTHTVLGGGIEWKRLNLKAGFRQHLLFNLPFFEEDGKSNYVDETLAIPQLRVAFKPDLGPIILHSHFAWQQQSRRELAMPSLYFKQRVAVTGTLFEEALEYQLGLDGLLFRGYSASRYFPAIGNFTLSNRDLDDTFRAEPWLAIRIQSFDAILRFENFGYIFTDRIDYQFDGYPLPDFQWRLKLRWQLND